MKIKRFAKVYFFKNLLWKIFFIFFSGVILFSCSVLSNKSTESTSKLKNNSQEKKGESAPSLQCISGNCVNGKGVAKDKSGDVYNGEFKDGLYHGEGSLKFLAGAEYIGFFQNGIVGGGEGVLTLPNGDQYIGRWENGRMNGIGTGIWVEGDKYIGYWKNNQFHGSGVLSIKGGLEYVGSWEDGSPNGAGILKMPEGTIYKGTFETKSEIYDDDKKVNYLPGRFYGPDGMVKKYTHIRSRDPKVKSGIFWEKMENKKDQETESENKE